MLNKLTINFETNFIEEILTFLPPETRKKAIKCIKEHLKRKEVRFNYKSDIPGLADEHLTVKEVRSIFRGIFHLEQIDPIEVQKRKAYYLDERVKRISINSPKLRKTIMRELKNVLIQQGIITQDDSEAWTGLRPTERREKIIYHAANNLNYLEREDVFNRVLSKDILSVVDKEARNIDLIKNLSNSEILPFLQKLIIHEKSLEREVKREALDTIIEVFISDFHNYKVAATRYFSLSDVYEILSRRVCLPDRQGKIGQKAAGMILAHKILMSEKSELKNYIRIPESFYLTSDVFFESLSSHTFNFSSLRHQLAQGVITEDDLWDIYPKVHDLILSTVIPEIIRVELRELLINIGGRPVIVRSSSLLEDSESAFSGKYESHFLANQPLDDDPEKDIELRLDKLIENILKVFASTLKPEALIYRRERGLLNVDERMCVLIQIVEGRRFGKYFFPALSGVGLSHNHRTNTEKIKWNDPLLRMGFGLGTGMVDIKGNQVKIVYPTNPDYSTIINITDIVRSSQRKLDALNMEDDVVESVTKEDLFSYFNKEKDKNPVIREFMRKMGRYILDTQNQDYLSQGTGLATQFDSSAHVFTFSGLKSTEYFKLTDWILRTIAEKYQPSDMEFTACFPLEDADDEREFVFSLVQCRKLTGQLEKSYYKIPDTIPEANCISRIDRNVVTGYAPNIEFIVYVDPEKYYALDETHKHTTARYIGHLNFNLSSHRFILIGPGRWGSSTPAYGLKVNFSEIYHTKALIEIARKIGDDRYAETSLGSHFGNDVRESQMAMFSIYPDSDGTLFFKEKLDKCPNIISAYFEGIPLDDWVQDVIKVIDVKTIHTEGLETGRQVVHVISNSEEQKGVILLNEPHHLSTRHEASPNQNF
ncbi:PEP/pyruvate-binding domain-containing protein [candidate division KSB1 bacterium]